MTMFPRPIGLSLAALAFLPVAGLAQEPPPLKEAKLNIEHNGTDHDTGFQGAIDSEGWQSLVVTGPGGEVLRFEGVGALGKLGLTELFFETVEPVNADVPIEELLKQMPEGEYRFEGVTMESGEGGGPITGIALLTHAIPAGPVLLSPAADAVVPASELLVSWAPVTTTISGEPVNIIAYQLIVETDEPPQPHMIGKFGLSMYLSPEVNHIELPEGFLEAATSYQWEVLAIEESGNQTLSSGSFKTQ
jgi:hypothetical protein